MLLLSALGVDENAVNNNGNTALSAAINDGDVARVRTLLELNVDTKGVNATANTNADIVALLEEHGKRSVERVNFVLFCFVFICFVFIYIKNVDLYNININFKPQLNERVEIRNRVLEAPRARIEKFLRFEFVRRHKKI